MSKVFISYSSEDSKFVERLVADLQERSVEVWYAKHEIKVGDSILAKIDEALGASDWLLLVMSQRAIKSNWVQLELGAALALTVQRGAYILVARIESVPIPPILADRRYADFTVDYQAALTEVLAVVAPGTGSWPDAKSQIAWAKMSAIFAGLLSVKWADAETRHAYLADCFEGLKNDWHMNDEVFDLYLDASIRAGRLLHVIEFIKLIPSLDTQDPRMHSAFRFVMENATRG